MSKSKMVKKLLATAFAVAGLAFAGVSADACDKSNVTGFAADITTQNGIKLTKTDTLTESSYNYNETTEILQSASGSVKLNGENYQWSWTNPGGANPIKSQERADYEDNEFSIDSPAYFYNLSNTNGGAVSTQDASVSINSDFISNSANVYYSSGSGGAVSIIGGTVDFIGNFIENSAVSSGGAIYVESGKVSSLKSDFIGNSVTSEEGKGGAIYNAWTITLAGNDFIGNTVNGELNGIYNASKGKINIADGATVNIYDGYTSESGATLSLGSGSTLNLNLNNGEIKSESLGSVTNNGAIYWALDANLNTGARDSLSTTLSSGNSIIINAINIMADATGDSKEITLDGNYFSLSNTINSHITYATGVTKEYVVTLNDAHNILTFSLKSETPTDPTFETLADAVSATEPATREYDLSGNEIVKTDLGTLGGTQLSVDGGEDKYSVSGGSNKGISVGSGQKLILKNLSGFNGFSSNNGSAIYSDATSAVIDIDDVTFSNNNANASESIGGAIYLYSGTATIDNATFSNNQAVYGGAIYTKARVNNVLNTSDLTISNSLFSGNTASEVGAVGIMRKGIITDTDFVDNTATNTDTSNIDEGGAGALFLGSESYTTLTGGTFDSNISGTRGGAISTRKFSADTNNTAKLDISGTKFIDNQAATNGGAIDNYFYGSSAEGHTDSVYITNATFGTAGHGNSAQNGGAIYNHIGKDGDVLVGGNTQVGKMYIANSSFTNNTASANGGAIYNEGIITLAGESTFSGNTANGQANDIYNVGTLNIGGTANLSGGINGITDSSTTGLVNITDGVTTTPTILNQTVTVSGGELALTNGDDTGTNIAGSVISVASGAIINTIDNVINDYTGKINLTKGSIIKGDLDYAQGTADKYGYVFGESETGSYVTYKIANVLAENTQYGDEKTIQVTSDGVQVNKDSDFNWYNSDYGLTLESSGQADGKIKVKGTAGGINSAVETTTEDGSQSEVQYDLTANETFNSTNGIKNSNFTIAGQGTESTDFAIKLAVDMIVDGDVENNGAKASQLTINNAIFTTDSANKIVNQQYSTLTINNSKIGVVIRNVGTTYITDSTVGKIINEGVMYADPVNHDDRLVNSNEYSGEGDIFNNLGSLSVNGGAIENSGILTLTKEVDGSEIFYPIFTENKGLNGGAIYNIKGKDGDDIVVNISDAIFTSNTAANDGGAIYNSGEIVINGGIFTGNSAGRLGGAIYSSNNLTINANSTNGSVIFSGNTQGSSVANDVYMAGTSGSPITMYLNSSDTTNTIFLGSGVDGNYYNIYVNDGTTNSGDVTIASINGSNVGATINAGTLNVTNNSTIKSLTANTATLNATNGLTVDTLTVGDGKTFTNNTDLTVNITLTNGSSTTNKGTIDNKGTLTLKGSNMVNVGDITSTATTGGNLNISGVDADHLAKLTSNGTITGNEIEINQYATLNTLADAIIDKNGSIVNNGILELRGADSTTGSIFANSVATSTTGHTDIVGGLVKISDSTNVINQAINIKTSGVLEVASASSIGEAVDNAVANGLVLKGGNLAQNVTGTNGSTKIDGTVTINDSAYYIQQAINIASGSLTANAGSIKGAVDNAVASGSTGLVLTGGTLASGYNVTGTGTTDIGTTTTPATVTNNAKISTPITIQGTSRLITSGSNADTAGDATSGIVGAVTNNGGTLQLTGGKVIVSVSGAGTTEVTGTVTNNSTIGNAVEITGSGNLTTATSGLTSTTATKNAGTLVFNNSADDSLGQSIEKNGENGGTVRIATTNGAVIDMTGKTITDNIIKLTSGTLKTVSTDGAVDLSGATKIVAGDGILDIQDGKTGTINLGIVDTASKALLVNLDVDLGDPTQDPERHSASDLLTVDNTNSDLTNLIKLNSIKWVDSTIGEETEADILVADDTVTYTNASSEVVSAISLGSAEIEIDTLDPISGELTGVANLLVSKNYVSGTGTYLHIKHTDLTNAIISTVDDKNYVMTADSSVSIDALPLNGSSLVINGNNSIISSDATTIQTKNGIDVNGNNLTVFNATIGGDNTTTNGFDVALDNTDGGNITLNNVTMTGNKTDIDNSGDNAGQINLNGVTMTDNITNIINDGEITTSPDTSNGVFITGASSINKIAHSGTDAKGQTTIGNGDTTTDTATIGEIIQKNVNVLSDGVLNIAADKLQTTSGTDNAGTLNLSGTSGTATPSALASAIGNIAGTTNITGNIATNGHNITQNYVNVGTTAGKGNLTNYNTINANNIVVTTESILENNSTIAAANGTDKALITANAGSEINLNKGSNAKADLTLEGTDTSKSMLTITDSGKLNGNVISDSGSTIELIADTQDITMSNAITGAISGSTAGSNGVYALVAHSVTNTPPTTVYSVTIDKAIAGATSISVDEDTKATITDVAIGSNTTTPINVSNNAELTLKNTTAGTMNVENAITKAGSTDKYDVIVNNTNAAGITNINNTIIGADTVTGDGGTTNLKSIITGADKVIAKAGTTNIDAGTNSNTSSRIGLADIEVKNNAIAGIKTTSDSFVLDSDVTGESAAATLQLNGKSGTPESPSNVGTQFTIASTINGGTVELANGQLNLPTESGLTNADGLRIGGGATLNTMNGATSDFNKPTEFEDGAQLKIDANVFTRATDRFINPTEGTNEKLTDITVGGLDRIYNTRSVNLTSGTGLNNLQAGIGLSDLISSRYPYVVTPVRLLKGQVQQTDEGLMLQFVPTSDGYEGFNSAVLAAPIAAQMGGYLTQLHSYDEAFRNMDMYMLMTKEERQAMKMRNKFATTSKDIIYDPTTTQYENKAGWFRPYATFENVGLDNGPRVSNVAYGTYVGGDSEMYDLGHGWDGMWGAYVGYNGSHQAYGNHNSIYQNGGTLGLVGMAYKGDFFTGLTINAGANGAEASTMYGSENFTMLMAGIASKTGYNWELANGKFIIQPSALVSYSFVNTFDYRNAAGIDISNDPLHAIQIEPGIKFIGNLKNGWQPYASVSMVWNIMDKTHFHANEVALPDMSVKPFVKYGVGVRKSWGERFTAFFQTYFTNGGRNGIGLQAGFRWTLGGNKSSVKTSNNTQVRKEIKSR